MFGHMSLATQEQKKHYHFFRKKKKKKDFCFRQGQGLLHFLLSTVPAPQLLSPHAARKHFPCQV